MPVAKFSSHLTAPREAEEDDISAYNGEYFRNIVSKRGSFEKVDIF